MSDATLTLLILAPVTYALKSAGPLALAGRVLPARLARLVSILPVPLFAALIVISTVADGEEWAFDARFAGVAAAGLALWRKLPFVLVVIIAGAATAGVRAAGG